MTGRSLPSRFTMLPSPPAAGAGAAPGQAQRERVGFHAQAPPHANQAGLGLLELSRRFAAYLLGCAVLLAGCAAPAPVAVEAPPVCASEDARRAVLAEARDEFLLGVYDDTYAELEACARHLSDDAQAVEAYRLLALYYYYDVEDQARADEFIRSLLALDRGYVAPGTDRPYFREGVDRLRPRTFGQKVGAFVSNPWVLGSLGLAATGSILCATEVLAACRPPDLPVPRVPVPSSR